MVHPVFFLVASTSPPCTPHLKLPVVPAAPRPTPTPPTPAPPVTLPVPLDIPLTGATARPRRPAAPQAHLSAIVDGINLEFLPLVDPRAVAANAIALVSAVLASPTAPPAGAVSLEVDGATTGITNLVPFPLPQPWAVTAHAVPLIRTELLVPPVGGASTEPVDCTTALQRCWVDNAS